AQPCRHRGQSHAVREGGSPAAAGAFGRGAGGPLRSVRLSREDRSARMTDETNADARGRQLREQIFGAEGMKGLVEADDFTMPLQDMVSRICFGEVWSRPGLSLK